MGNVWRAMQFVEANRHYAEQLERRAADGSPSYCRLIGSIAVQRRQLAEQMHHLAMGRPIPPIEPLRAR